MRPAARSGIVGDRPGCGVPDGMQFRIADSLRDARQGQTDILQPGLSGLQVRSRAANVRQTEVVGQAAPDEKHVSPGGESLVKRQRIIGAAELLPAGRLSEKVRSVGIEHEQINAVDLTGSIGSGHVVFIGEMQVESAVSVRIAETARAEERERNQRREKGPKVLDAAKRHNSVLDDRRRPEAAGDP